MWQRFTIDILSNHVADQLMIGEPTARLGYRFFRKGRRDGRKNFDHESVGRLLREAVRLAAEKLADEMAGQRTELAKKIAAMESSIEHDIPEPTLELLIPPTPEPSDAENVRGPSLGRALEVRAAAMSKAAELELEIARKAAEDARQQARDDLERQRMALNGLPAAFEPRALGVVHSGQVLWTRYCNGFAQGDARRRRRRWWRRKPRPEDPVKPPRHDVIFSLPPEFDARMPSGEAALP